MSEQLTVDQAIQLALEHQRAGQLAEAEDIFRQILGAYPDQADVLHLLGGVYLQAKRPDLAEANVRHALLLRAEPAFSLTLGLILQSSQRVEEAVGVYRSLLADKPNSVDAHIHLGVALSMLGRFKEAADAFQAAVNLAPAHPVAQGNLGIVLCHLRRYDEAQWLLKEAVAKHPKNADFHSALGASLYFTKQPEAALAACNQAIALNPALGQAYSIVGQIHKDLGRREESAAAAKRAAELLPDVAEAQVHYGEKLREAGDLDGAAAHYRRALTRLPDATDLHNNLGNLLKDQGLLDDAIVAFNNALTLRPPASPVHFSNYLYTLHYHPAYTADRLAAELDRYNELVSAPVRAHRPRLANDRSPGRRLRVGYISSEFRQHALGLNILPLLARHDKSQFEVFCYSHVEKPDFYTFRLRQAADTWRDVHALDDAELADRIQRDGIDILVDLHQHIGGNKLPVFARKPAPVQIAFAGYPGSSGLETMDFRLTDPYLEPPGRPQQVSPEVALRLPHSFWCYHPAVDVPANELPALQAGRITFGNLNNFCKLNDGVYELWARIMAAVEGSTLVLLAPEGSHRARTKATFERLGVAADRVRFVDRQPSGAYYRLYHGIDLSLDSFPCNGHTTSMDSFWMGVPVTTYVGDRLFGRATWSQVNNLGLTELAGATGEEFVALSVALAKDLPRLAEYRRTLRDRMKASPLMDEAGFARGIEAAYREAWTRHCAGDRHEHGELPR
jgi:predicted O-linked N-acetylglucosamine transferase (SPINDLY family)